MKNHTAQRLVWQGSVLSGLLWTAALLAEEPSATTSPPPAERPAAARGIRLHLMDGSVVTGRLSSEAVSVDTEFGRLDVPVSRIVSFTPGLDSHPEERQRIARLIQQLGSNAAAERDAAQRALSEQAHAIQNELARYTADEDAERRTRVVKILAELEEADVDEEADAALLRPWISGDTLETTLFTVVGRLSPQSFTVQTQYGPLTVAISDIRRGEREADQKPEVRKSVTVRGDNIVQRNLLSSGVRVAHGDRVSLTADGKLVMSPWGNNVTVGPDGSEQFQWYVPNQIAGGTLVARIGTGGKVFKVGSKHTFTATRSGTLYLGVAMNPQFSGEEYSYPGEYNVKVRVNPR